jgi:hypothetical protein
MNDKNTVAVPEPKKPALTCDPVAIATNVKTHVAALEKDAAALTPLLGFALTSLRGALSALNGHVKAAAPSVQSPTPSAS